MCQKFIKHTYIDIIFLIGNNFKGSSFTALAVGQLVAAIKTNGHHKFEVAIKDFRNMKTHPGFPLGST